MAELILYYWPYAMAAAVSFVFLALYWDERTKRLAVERRFSVVIDADAEARDVVRRFRILLMGKTSRIFSSARLARTF